MPYFGIHTSQKLSKDERTDLKAKIGEAIALIPNKREAVLMIEFQEAVDFYFGGDNSKDYAYVDLRCFQNAPYEANKAFTERVYGIFNEVLGLDGSQIYLTVTEYPNWGVRGTLK